MNRLAEETSPYLRQHADNPVDWFPWSDEALRSARDEDKPIFLSIGYASCHWCHVMAHESFEDPATAADLSRWFVSVKVDREERPDLDAIYMAATQTLTGSGGWPMSVFCTPDGRPFYAGTYFPPEERHGMPAFRRVLRALGEAWETQRDQVLEQAEALVEAVHRELRLAETMDERVRAQGGVSTETESDGFAGRRDDGAGKLGRSGEGEGDGPAARGRQTDRLEPAELISRIVGDLAAGFDPDWGGFGTAPKFPRPTLVELSLRHARSEDSGQALFMAQRTLDGMAAGGIYDHLVGGFCRYATDARWLVPHFEKMLTDQALLARAYLHAWQETGNSEYLAITNETLEFVLRDLSTPEGALFSSFDADAGGVEGGHATFTMADVRRILPAELVQPTAEWYGITEHGNWEGRSIPVRPVGAPHTRPTEIEEARALLAAARATRTQPARDEKVLTEWNAMTAASLAEVASATANARYGDRAEEIVEFLLAAMYTGGRLMRSWQGGRARHLAVGADYAWLVEACVRLSEWTGKSLWRERAVRVANEMIDLFFDDQEGGFFTTGSDAEHLVVRPKEFLDGALPATNSIAVTSLLRAGALADDARIDAAVDRTIGLARHLLEQHPMALADLVSALPMQTARRELVVTGERPDLLETIRTRWLPTAVLAWGEPDEGPLFEGRPSQPGRAYVCQARTCLLPTGDAEQLSQQLETLER